MILASVETPLGTVTLASDGEALTGLYFEGQAHRPDLEGSYTEAPVFVETRAWLSEYFAGRIPQSAPKLHLFGTPFQKRVWEALRSIPYGQTVSYAALAARLNSSARAVGGAVGRNPVSLIVPCHRVIGSRGALTGYAGGIARKSALLALERGGAIGCEYGATRV